MAFPPAEKISTRTVWPNTPLDIKFLFCYPKKKGCGGTNMYHMRLRGSHAEIGKKIGRALRMSGKDFYALTKLDDFQKMHGQNSEQILYSYFPEIREEIYGAAQELNFPEDRLACWLLTMGCCYDIRGCTAFAFRRGKNVYYGRNNDLPPFLKKASCSALYLPADGGNRFLLNTSSFINGEEGINEHGFACAMTFVPPNTTEICPGLNSVFIVRYLLERAKNAENALSLLLKLPVASACNILLADSSGAIFACECSPQKCILLNNNSDYVYITNNFQCAEMEKYSAHGGDIFRSRERLQTCASAFQKYQSDCGSPFEFTENLLSGKYGFLCQYSKAENFDTIWASIFDLSGCEIWRAEGNPSTTKFRKDERAKLLFR